MRDANAAFALAEQPGCQRWRRRRASYRPPGEPFDPARHAVDVVEEREGRAFVQVHHYSHSWPATRLAVGLFRRGRTRHELAGVAAFSVPMHDAVLKHHLGVGLEAGVELGRLVLEEEVEGNGESWFIARALRAARQRLGIQRVLAFCDPVERRDADGNLQKRGHLGVVYRATNFRYVGRSTPRTLLVLPNGTVLSDRAASKVRRGEQGVDYVLRQLRDAGASPRQPHEVGAAYLARLRTDGSLTRLRHPGNLAFALGLPKSQAEAPTSPRTP